VPELAPLNAGEAEPVQCSLFEIITMRALSRFTVLLVASAPAACAMRGSECRRSEEEGMGAALGRVVGTHERSGSLTIPSTH